MTGRQNSVISMVRTTMTIFEAGFLDGIFVKIRPDLAFLLVENFMSGRG